MIHFYGEEDFPCSLEGKVRQKGLYQLDETMSWALPFSSRTFSLKEKIKAKVFQTTTPLLEEFSFLHGYFSCFKPLVGIVTEEVTDVIPVQKALISLTESNDMQWIKIATEELLTKALAYRNLQKGMKILIPHIQEGKAVLLLYEVDAVLNLWQGMPAFGLVSLEKKAESILLFRGTDFSMVSKSSWASILSDLDFQGAGFSTFRMAEKQIHDWLEKVSFEKKVKVMGFSLGGALAFYTTIYQSSFVKECIAFNAPGVSKLVFEDWKNSKQELPIIVYATQGDVVSKVGKILPMAFELTDKKPMGPIESHAKLMTAKSSLLLFHIDMEKENKDRFKKDF